MINKGAESLPNKDAQTYKQLAKLYDSKNYKKGLKNADKLLEIHPDHPETNSLKALFLQAVGEESKAVDVAKMGLIKSKMKSMFCWHTCASIYKQKKDFNEAAKCFQNALRIEPGNQTIMRQAACLQVQVRDLTNHTASRYNILKLKPNMIQNWVAFAVAHHLRGDFPALFKALGSLDNLVKTADLKPTELAHYYVYRVVTFRDAGDFQGMYNELKKNKSEIKDDIFYHEMLYQACNQLKKTDEAILSTEALLVKFPENLEYLKQYQDLHSLNRREACAKARSEFKSKIAHVHELACIDSSQQFRKCFAVFIKPYYQKNLISLYAEIQVLYEVGKYDDIEAIFKEHELSLEKDTYPDGTEVASPSDYLWSLYLLAQHYSQRYETLTLAHEYISKAIKHTCTVPEFYLVRTQIEFKQHNNIQSLKTINEARKTDLADRYMNNICVKYLMKCQKPDIGETMLRNFMRDDASLYELQNHWYIIEAGKSFLKQRQFEAGLRHLDFINKQFLDFQANQLDFHTYCYRKWSLKEYVELIQFNDNIYDDKKYAQAAGFAIRYLKEYVIYLKEEEQKSKEKIEESKEETQAKKKKKKKKNAEQLLAQEETPVETFRKKIDYYGKQYCEKINKNPMEEALNYAKCISSIKYTNRGNPKENKLFGRAFSEAIDVFIYFKKPLLVLRCLNKLKRSSFSPFEIHHAHIKAIIYLQSYLVDEKSNDLAKEMVTEFLDSTLNGKSLAEYNQKQTSQWKELVESRKRYLIDSKKTEASILLKNSEARQQFIEFHLKELTSLSKGDEPKPVEMELIFYHTHHLEYYGKLTSELKGDLNKRVGKLTSYFSDWRAEVMKLPESTWSMWWLSDYDIEREEQDEKDEKAQAEKAEKAEKSEKESTKTEEASKKSEVKS